MTLRSSSTSALIVAFTSLFALGLGLTTGCDGSGGRTCDTDDDCFVGESCIEGFCISDSSDDAGDTTHMDAGDDGSSDVNGGDDSGDDDTGGADGGGQDAEQDTGSDADAHGDAGSDTGSDAGRQVPAAQTCRPSSSPALAPPWLVSLGTSNADRGRDVAVDSSGQVYVVGSFTGDLDVGGCELNSGYSMIGRSNSALVVKLSANGEILWAKSFADPEGAVATNVAIGSNDRVYLFGYFDGVIDLGGGPLENEDFGTDDINRSDLFVAALESDGSHVWSNAFNGNQADRPGGIALDGSDNVYLTGWFEETLTIGNRNLTSQTLGEDDIFVAKLTSTGAVQWAARHGGDGRDQAHDIAVDSAGNAYVIGRFEGTADFGTGDVASNDESDDVFLAKYDTQGDAQWVEIFGAGRDDEGHGVAYDDANDAVLVTGGYRGQPAVGGQFLDNAQILNIFLARLDAQGNFDWAESYGGDRADWGRDVAVDASGSVYVTGSALSAIDFGGDELDPLGGESVFVASFDSSANHRWSRAYGNFGQDSGQAVAVTPSGQASVTGAFNDALTFGASEFTSNGREDLFVLSIDP